MTQNTTRRPSGGVLAEEKIHAAPNTLAPSVRERFLRLADLSSTVSDVLDHLGVQGCVGSSAIRPSIADGRTVGRAITVRNVPQKSQPYVNAQQDLSLMNELEGVNQAQPGDVLVIQGLPEVSNMGGMVSGIAKRQGLVGAIVDGGVRDLDRSRKLGFPVWSTHVSPITGKYRCVTEEVNGPVKICGVSVYAGDLVIADETGVCFVPRQYIEEVLTRCEAIGATEDEWEKDFSNTTSIPDIMKKVYKQLRDDDSASGEAHR